MTRDEFTDSLGLSRSNPFAKAATAALRLRTGTDEGPGASRIGGLPDLPADTDWPHWDPRAYFQKELERAQESGGWPARVQQYAERLDAAPRPLSFLAQLRCADLDESVLPLPAKGLLSFFYDLEEQPWGYDPLHRGAWRVLYTGPDAELVRRTPPDDLDPERAVPLKPLQACSVWTLSRIVEDAGETYWHFEDPEAEQAFERLRQADPEPWHQVGGHPDPIQGDMQRACCLVTQGVYLGGPTGVSEAELERLATSAPDWRLLFQFASDDDIDWMWGDLGKLYFWMREQDIAAGAWDRAWLQLQCS